MLPPNFTYILARSAASAPTCRRRAHFAIGTFGVLLFDVGVEGRVAEVGLRAVAALEVAPFHVVLATALSLPCPVVVLVVVILRSSIVLPFIALSASASHVLDCQALSLAVALHSAHHVGHTMVATLRHLASLADHIVASLAVSHIGHLVTITAVSCRAAWLLVHGLPSSHELAHRTVEGLHLILAAHSGLVAKLLAVAARHVLLAPALLLLSVHRSATLACHNTIKVRGYDKGARRLRGLIYYREARLLPIIPN